MVKVARQRGDAIELRSQACGVAAEPMADRAEGDTDCAGRIASAGQCQLLGVRLKLIRIVTSPIARGGEQQHK